MLLLTGLALPCMWGCSTEANMFGTPVRQYADYVLGFSSQYGINNYSSLQALGQENVYPQGGDDPYAWSPSTRDGQREFLELGFDSAQTVTKIEIYETWYPGAIDTIFLRKETGEYIKVYAESAIDFAALYPDSARIFTVHVDPPVYQADGIRLEINSIDIEGWHEIDAVAITGFYVVSNE